MKKYLLFLLLFAACKKENNSPNRGCWECTMKVYIDGTDTGDSATFYKDCETTQAEIEKFESDNSGYFNGTVNGDSVKMFTETKCKHK